MNNTIFKDFITTILDKKDDEIWNKYSTETEHDKISNQLYTALCNYQKNLLETRYNKKVKVFQVHINPTNFIDSLELNTAKEVLKIQIFIDNYKI